MKEFNLEVFKEIVSLSNVSCYDASIDIFEFAKDKYSKIIIDDVEFFIGCSQIQQISYDSMLKNIKFFEVFFRYQTKKNYEQKVETKRFNKSDVTYSYSEEFKNDYTKVNKIITLNEIDLDYKAQREGNLQNNFGFYKNYYFVAYKSLFFETTLEEYNDILKERYTELDKQSLVEYLEKLKTI